jgi:hypothetical protein
MAISNVVPASTSNLASYVTATSANVLYTLTQSFASGIYTISCASSTVATVDFFDGTQRLVSAKTVSGTVAVNLASAATSIRYFTDTGSSIQIGIALTGAALSGTSISGTLDTITTSGTYSQTGNVYVMVVGGGQAGYQNPNNGYGAAGGQSGNLKSSYLYLTGTQTVTIGTAGTGGNGGLGGDTVFGSLSSSGGINAPATYGSYNTQAGNGTANALLQHSFIKSGTTGSGGGGSATAGLHGVGGGSGIGTGGAGNSTGGNGSVGTGYGAGGGGCSAGGTTGGNGTAGVVYVLRGW